MRGISRPMTVSIACMRSLPRSQTLLGDVLILPLVLLLQQRPLLRLLCNALLQRTSVRCHLLIRFLFHCWLVIFRRHYLSITQPPIKQQQLSKIKGLLSIQIQANRRSINNSSCFSHRFLLRGHRTPNPTPMTTAPLRHWTAPRVLVQPSCTRWARPAPAFVQRCGPVLLQSILLFLMHKHGSSDVINNTHNRRFHNNITNFNRCNIIDSSCNTTRGSCSFTRTCSINCSSRRGCPIPIMLVPALTKSTATAALRASGLPPRAPEKPSSPPWTPLQSTLLVLKTVDQSVLAIIDQK